MQTTVTRKLVSTFFLSALVLAAAGCAHSHKIQSQETRGTYKVDIGAKEVKEGERVRVFRSVCRNRPALRQHDDAKVCQEQVLGQATVTTVLDDNTAIIRPDAGIEMNSDVSIEKL